MCHHLINQVCYKLGSCKQLGLVISLICQYAIFSSSTTGTRSKRPISGNLVFTTAMRAANTSENTGEAIYDLMYDWQKSPRPRTRF
uniref:Uncharacterized protein n=1 Tax=Arundo donax TaxID=35708 RepID=A0A0A8ZVV7_ARUDO